MEYKTIIDSNGNIVDLCVIFIDGQAQYFKMQEGQQAVERYAKNYIKPRWNGSEWIEGATEEEIKVLQEENKIEQEPSEQEKLNAQSLQVTAQQQLINASLLKQIAELKGGN